MTMEEAISAGYRPEWQKPAVKVGDTVLFYVTARERVAMVALTVQNRGEARFLNEEFARVK
jgi:hypothetical protein